MRYSKETLYKWMLSKQSKLNLEQVKPLYDYVCVLLQKPMPPDQLKSSIKSSLHELMGNNTCDFVDELFDVVLKPSHSSDDSPERPSRRSRNNRSRSRSPHKSSSGRYRRSRSPLDTSEGRSTSKANNNGRRGRHHVSESRRHHTEYSPEEVDTKNSNHHRIERAHDRRPRGRNSDEPSDDIINPSQQQSQPIQRPKCRNFEEKGFCNYGDRCRFEHGSNPVVVPAAWTTSNLFDPSLTVPGAAGLLPTPNTITPGLLEANADSLLPSGIDNVDVLSSEIPTYNPTPIVESHTRKPGHRVRANPVNNKNIIAIPTVDTSNAYDPASTIPPAYEPARPELLSGDEERNDQEVALPTATANTTSDYTPSPINPPVGQQPQQCSLLVSKLPWNQNDVEQLREHFSRFGNIISVQTHYLGNHTEALITYATPAEAEAAYRSPEPILSNRFIRTHLYPQPNHSNPVALANSGGRFRNRRNNGDGLGFSHFGSALLGDAQPPRLPAKLRLGQGPSGAFKRTYRGDAAKIGELSAIAGTKPTSTTTSSRRSRWRLERDENGNPISGDDDEDDDGEDEDFRNDLHTGDGAAAILDIGDGDEDGARKRLRSSDFCDSEPGYSHGRTSRNSFSLADQEAAEAEAARQKANWERKKSIALKEHQARLAQLEKEKAVRRHAERERKSQILKLTTEAKETVAKAKECKDKAAKQILLAKVHELMATINELQKHETPRPKRLDDAKQQTMVQQMLPDTVATERLEKIAEVKKQLAEAELALQEAGAEKQAEIRKSIVSLKRQLVNLETIRPSDLAAIDSQTALANRPHTKLDNRPRVIYVTGHLLEDVEPFRHALHSQYMHTESFQSYTCGVDKEPVLEITFRTRDIADRALRIFTSFHGRALTLSFSQPASLIAELSGANSDSKPPVDSSEVVVDFDEDDDLSVPVVDATVEDDFRSPKHQASLSP